MALPAHLVERFSPALTRALRLGAAVPQTEPCLSFGLPLLDELLPDGGVLRGAVVELAVGEGVPATTLMLSACANLQRSHAAVGRELPWCAFLDPSSSLYAPGVIAAGVNPERLLVVRPPVEAVARTALRLAKSPAFELLVVDAVGVPGSGTLVPIETWPRLVRRLAMEVQNTERTIILLTDLSAPRALPLPVAQRIELTRPALDRMTLRVAKDRRGHVTPPRPVAWTRARQTEISALEPELPQVAVG